MDKREYQEKLDEINRLIALEDYEAAAKVADSIDWRRVRNVQTLVMVSEIYEAVGRYEDSKILLQRAYRRSPVGRTVLYRLVECTIKLGQFDEAIEYYSEYVQAAPHDNNRYILKYKIYKARGSSLDEQIDILKQYLDQEYNEKWAYELAKLQVQADRVPEAIGTCDDLVLWFHSGKYVIKALELKRRYAPLTPKQQEIYDNRFNEPEDEMEDEIDDTSYLAQAQSLAKAGRAAAAQEEIKSELARDISRAARLEERAAEEASAAEEAAEEAAETPAEEIEAETPAEETAAETPTGEVEAETSVEETEAETPAEETATEAPAEEIEAEAPAEEIEAEAPAEEIEAETSAEEIEAEASEEETAVEVPAEEEAEAERDEKQLQEDMIRSMREIVSGVGPKDGIGEEETRIDETIEQSKVDQEDAVAARGADLMFRVPESAASQKRASAGKLTIDDILLSMGDGGARVREVTGGAVIPASEEEVPPVPQFLREEVREAKQTQELPVQEISDAADAAEAAEPFTAEDTEPAAAAEEKTGADEYANLPPLQHVEYTKEIAEAKTKKLPVEEIRRLHEVFLNESAPAAMTGLAAGAAATAGSAAETADKPETAAAAAAETVEPAAPQAEQPAWSEVPAQEEAPAREETPAQEETAAWSEVPVQEETPAPEEAPAQEETPAQEEAPAQEETPAQEEAPAQKETPKQEEAPAREAQQSRKGVPAQEAREVPGSSAPYYGSRPMLREDQKELFRGFIGIGSLEEQIANAITQAEGKQGDKTSRTGNILILGAHGCGKTTIGTGIAKAIAEDMGTRSVKMARIYAADLNRKDIAATIAKIAGGVLIVEEAGDLDDAIVDQLTTAMEFRTDGMIMILEDEQRYIHDLLMRHPRFTMKFTAQIYIPAYSSEDLVNFGQLYARSHDYVMSERAMAAFYDRITTASQNGETISITNVTELVDRAMKNANKFFRRIGSAKKRYDEEDRIILQEKDFR